MTNQELVAEAVKIIREDPGLYEACIDSFSPRDIFILIHSRYGVKLSEQEIAEELVKNDSVETTFRLKWEPTT